MASADSTKLTQTQENDIKLDLISRGRLATWLFIIACLFYFYDYDEEEKAIYASTKEEALQHTLNGSKAVELGGYILVAGVVLYAINSFDKLKFFLKTAPDNTELIRGQNLVAYSNLIKVLGFAGAAFGYTIVADDVEQTVLKAETTLK